MDMWQGRDGAGQQTKPYALLWSLQACLWTLSKGKTNLLSASSSILVIENTSLEIRMHLVVQLNEYG